MELLKNVLKDPSYVLYDLFPLKKMHVYKLRTRPDRHVLPIKNFLWTRIFWTECCMLICIDYLCMFGYKFPLFMYIVFAKRNHTCYAAHVACTKHGIQAV